MNTNSIQFTRKPRNWDDMAAISIESMDKHLGADWPSKLPVYKASELLASPTAGPLQDFRLLPPESLFILTNEDDGIAYLINTEGASYARYALVIWNYENLNDRTA